MSQGGARKGAGRKPTGKNDPIQEIDELLKKVFENTTQSPKWLLYFDTVQGEWIKIEAPPTIKKKRK